MPPSARILRPLTLGHRPNAGDETEAVEFAEGDEVEVMQRFEARALVKDPQGRLFTLEIEAIGPDLD